MIRFKLGELLAIKGITATEIFKSTGIAKSTISAIVNNNSEMIRLSTLNELCKYLEITPNELIEYSPIDWNFDLSFDDLNHGNVGLTIKITFFDKYQSRTLPLLGIISPHYSAENVKVLSGNVSPVLDVDKEVESHNRTYYFIKPKLSQSFLEQLKSEIREQIQNKFPDTRVNLDILLFDDIFT